ncbi:MAG: hypothetical protein F9K49_02000 [Caedimonadaceae bacterium]|nr:MAG: hypothetical protein F9K49_02000 [Caedimonadaceae bacterium]
MTDIVLKLPKKLRKSIEKQALAARISNEAFITKLLEREIISSEYIRPNVVQNGLPKLQNFLDKIPGVKVISFDKTHDYKWWVKFDIDIKHKLAWNVVQELGFVLNDLSLTERFPTAFMPVSPPPYLNGGPEDYLSWVIESKVPYLDPKHIAMALEDRLPRPVDDESQWAEDDE